MYSSKGAYSLGLVFIFLVSVIWSLSSVLVQYLYADQSFDSPFLVTYIGSSLFVLLLPSQWLWSTFFANDKDAAPVDAAGGYQAVEREASLGEVSGEGDASESSAGSGEPQPAAQCSRMSSLHETLGTDGSRSSLSLGDDEGDGETLEEPAIPWTHAEHRRAAYKIAPLWFMSNWAYNVSLQYTSITSSTVLASTGSLFTFCFAIIVGDENFSGYKLLGVALGMGGSIVTSLNDVIDRTSIDTGPDDVNLIIVDDDKDKGNLVWWGDLLGLISALGYGIYAVQIRTYTPEDPNRMSMQLLLGYIGLTNMIALSPICLYQMTVQHGHGLTWFVFGCLVVKGLTDNVLSDYLWASAVVLTSATVATVGLGLTIPMAFVSDWVLGKLDTSKAAVELQVVGALAVIVGFLLVNVGHEEEEEEGENSGQASPTGGISLEEMETRRYRDNPEHDQDAGSDDIS